MTIENASLRLKHYQDTEQTLRIEEVLKRYPSLGEGVVKEEVVEEVKEKPKSKK